MPSVSSSPLEPGAIIAGKYRVHRVLAEGGMGVIMEAENVALGQRVAVKFLLPEMQARPDVIERFLREARAAARLRSDHVVRVFDIGTDERGLPFMVMELLAGVDVATEIDSRGALPVQEAVGYVLEALDAIIEAHAAGIVHRDLKPANLFLSGKPGGARRVRVLDFGISKIMDDGAVEASLTSSQSMLGSPAYMSPEQVRSTKGVDARTDVWALGVILYEMLSGQCPFQGDSLGDVFAKIREEDVPPLTRVREDVPPQLALVVHHCLQRDRDKRMPSAVALREQLSPFGPRESQLGMVAAPRLSDPRIPAVTPSHPNLVVTAPLSGPQLLSANDSGRLVTSPVSERHLVEHAQTLAATGDLERRPTDRSRGTRGLLIASVGVLALGIVGAGAFIAARKSNVTSTTDHVPSAATPLPSAATASVTSPTASALGEHGDPPALAPSATLVRTPSQDAVGPRPGASSSRPGTTGPIRSAAPAASSPASVAVRPVAPPAAVSASAAPKKKDDLGL